MCDFSLQHAKSRPAVVGDGARWTRSFLYGPECRSILETAAELLVLVVTQSRISAVQQAGGVNHG
jgi:hypothetical protein